MAEAETYCSACDVYSEKCAALSSQIAEGTAVARKLAELEARITRLAEAQPKPDDSAFRYANCCPPYAILVGAPCIGPLAVCCPRSAAYCEGDYTFVGLVLMPATCVLEFMYQSVAWTIHGCPAL